MLHWTLKTGLVWLAAVALAAQGFGAAALADACGCTDCDCGPQDLDIGCCAGDAAANYGPPCCQTSLAHCSQSAPTTGSCCCQAGESQSPANLLNGNKLGPEGSLPPFVPALLGEAAPPPAASDILHTGFRCLSPPPRVLYCVWRN